MDSNQFILILISLGLPILLYFAPYVKNSEVKKLEDEIFNNFFRIFLPSVEVALIAIPTIFSIYVIIATATVINFELILFCLNVATIAGLGCFLLYNQWRIIDLIFNKKS